MESLFPESPRRLRVGIVSFKHESNTFISRPTGLRDFEEELVSRGEAIRTAYAEAFHDVGGMLEGLDRDGIEAVPLFQTEAPPGGPVTDEALDTLWAWMREAIEAAGPLDGLLAALHGAGVNPTRPDLDGWLLEQLRALIGPDKPLVATFDPHGNLTPTMAGACDALVAYRENPHIDMRECGLEAASLMSRTLHGEVRPAMAAAFPRVAINIERQSTFEEPMLSIKVRLEALHARTEVLSVSLFLGYPYADVAEMGSSFAVVTDGDAVLAAQLAQELGDFLEATRERYDAELISPEYALRAARNLAKPVALLDMGDNTGGGATADSTVLAHLLHERAGRGARSFICLADPDAAAEAKVAGVGARLMLTMGGKIAGTPATPFVQEVAVRSLHDGRFRETKPRHGGRLEFDMGFTAVVETDSGLTVMLTSKPYMPFSQQQMLSCALDPRDFDYIVLKGVNAPIAAYEDVCPHFMRVNTPGPTTADMASLTYHHRRRPLFPFEKSLDASPA